MFGYFYTLAYLYGVTQNKLFFEHPSLSTKYPTGFVAENVKNPCIMLTYIENRTRCSELCNTTLKIK